MLGKHGWTRCGWCGLAVLLLVQAGCLSFVHPLESLPPEEIQTQHELPDACKNRVYIFFLHGLDPLDLGNLAGLHDYIQSLGYIKTYYGLPFHAFYYEKEICKIRKHDPDARIVLIGFSYGAGLVRDITCSLRGHDIDVDLLVYIDGVEFNNRRLHRPANAHKVVNILSFNRSENRTLEPAETRRYNDVWHFGTVTHPRTVRMLVHELTAIAQAVPVITQAPEPIPGVIVPPSETLPVPAPDRQSLPAPTPVSKRGEWDFLKPDSSALHIPGRKPVAEAMGMPPASLQEK